MQKPENSHTINKLSNQINFCFALSPAGLAASAPKFERAPVQNQHAASGPERHVSWFGCFLTNLCLDNTRMCMLSGAATFVGTTYVFGLVYSYAPSKHKPVTHRIKKHAASVQDVLHASYCLVYNVLCRILQFSVSSSLICVHAARCFPW